MLTPVQPFSLPPRRSRRKRRRNRSRSCPPSPAAGPTHAASPHSATPLAHEAMEVQEADPSNEGHRDCNPVHNARPSPEAEIVGPPAPSAHQPAPAAAVPAAAEPLSSSSSPSSIPPATRSLTQPSPAVVDPHATPNPFAPLVDDAGGDVASHDVQRAPTSVSSACSSSTAIVSSAPSSVDAKVDDLVAAGPTQPAEVAAKPTVSKRPCTRSAAAAPTHGFFQRLATRPAAVRAHFQQLYPPTSRICPCGPFPGHSFGHPLPLPAHPPSSSSSIDSLSLCVVVAAVVALRLTADVTADG